MTPQGENQILLEVWTKDGNQGRIKITPIYIYLKTLGK
jgi:hypothetical protein